MDKQTVDKLVLEFKNAGLADTDAYRSAFTTLAYHVGWSTTTIARYLGITRVRASQRIARLHEYAATREAMPIFNAILEAAKPKGSWNRDIPVGFLASTWHDKQFALGVLYLLAEGIELGVTANEN